MALTAPGMPFNGQYAAAAAVSNLAAAGPRGRAAALQSGAGPALLQLLASGAGAQSIITMPGALHRRCSACEPVLCHRLNPPPCLARGFLSPTHGMQLTAGRRPGPALIVSRDFGVGKKYEAV